MRLFKFQKEYVDRIVESYKTNKRSLLPSLIPLGYGRAVIICAVATKLKKEQFHVYLSPCLAEQWRKIIKRERVTNIIINTTNHPIILT